MKKLKKVISWCLAIIVIGLLILFIDEKKNTPDEPTAPEVTVELDKNQMIF